MDVPSDSPRASEPRTEATASVESGHFHFSPAFQEFFDQFSKLPTPEEKIAYGLQFMRSSISQEGSPHFREFWEARRQILTCFKENLNPSIRSRLWDEYVELTVEARRLKEIFEEQSAFAIEQIDLAIGSIEADLANFDSLIASAGVLQFPEQCETIAQHKADYSKLQSELNLLNTLASRLMALRKEVVKTDMRIRFKTKFFKRLATLGDPIFPRRKNLIDSVSAQFEQDVDQFVARYFKGGQASGAPYYSLREEIKELQGMAKFLTLSSGAFSRTRLKLSECWDQVKALEKEHKREVFEKKQASSEQRQSIEKKIEELKPKAPEMSLRDLDKEIDEIVKEMREVALHRDDVRGLRDELSKLRAPHIAAQEQKARELEAAEKELLRVKREAIARIKEEISALVKGGSDLEVDVLSFRFEELIRTINQLEAPKIEKQQLERALRPVRDLVADKKERSLLNLSDDDRKNLDNLRTVLQNKKERRQEIKETLESYRKVLGSSDLDFEKAMHFRELIDQERERLDKANEAIQEVEEKIAELEG